ncbi:MAG: hypothetical protein LBJ47_08700 [Tannerella sp.]|jgi:hypothetical protein|nr:hypothetical protein [Tannerella sp.]
MKRKQFVLLVAALCVCCSSCKNEKLAVAGSGWQEIAIVDKASGTVEWKHQLDDGEECNDIEVTPDGHILYAYSKGARLITRSHETVWDYRAGENEEIHSAARLEDGSFMIGVCGEPARIVELDRDGRQTKEVTFRTLVFDTHWQFRQIAKTDDGLYLVPVIGKRKILQITPEGSYRGSIYIGRDLFSVKILKNKNLLVSCGSDNLFMEINPATQHPDSMIITNSVRGASLLYIGEIFLYENGNRLIANSNMYSDNKSQSPLIEIDENNEVVWSLPFNREIKNITSVCSFFE